MVEVLTAEAVGGVRPGAVLSRPIVVRNTGEVPVSGLGLQVGLGQLEFEQRHANCRYPGIHRGLTMVCEFPDLRIAPGETVTLRPALRLRTNETEMYASLDSEAWALDMGAGPVRESPGRR